MRTMISWLKYISRVTCNRSYNRLTISEVTILVAHYKRRVFHMYWELPLRAHPSRWNPKSTWFSFVRVRYLWRSERSKICCETNNTRRNLSSLQNRFHIKIYTNLFCSRRCSLQNDVCLCCISDRDHTIRYSNSMLPRGRFAVCDRIVLYFSFHLWELLR